MKKKSLFLSIVIVFCFALSMFAGCGGEHELKENIVDDKYDNYYEIFVYSFYDSDGNGVGDFN